MKLELDHFHLVYLSEYGNGENDNTNNSSIEPDDISMFMDGKIELSVFFLSHLVQLTRPL